MYSFIFFYTEIAWVLSIAVPFRGCSLVRWRASNDELRSLPTQCSGSLTPSSSCFARSLPRSYQLVRSPLRLMQCLSYARAASLVGALEPSSRSLPSSVRKRERNRSAIAGSRRRRAERQRKRKRKRKRDNLHVRKRQERIYLPVLSARR